MAQHEGAGTRATEPFYDAGDLACGELLIELRRRILAIRPGETILVRARDLAAPLDIPAWCWTTGNALVWEKHPDYRIRRGEPKEG